MGLCVFTSPTFHKWFQRNSALVLGVQIKTLIALVMSSWKISSLAHLHGNGRVTTPAL